MTRSPTTSRTGTQRFRTATDGASAADETERAAQRYGVPAHESLQRVGEAGYVGGQEDMIIDVALELAAERERAA